LWRGTCEDPAVQGRAAATWWVFRHQPWWRQARRIVPVLIALHVLSSLLTRSPAAPTTVGLTLLALPVFLLLVSWRIAGRAADGVARQIGLIDTGHVHLRMFRPGDQTAVLATVDAELKEAAGWTEGYVAKTFAAAARFGWPDAWLVVDQGDAVLGVVVVRPKRGAGSTCDLTWWMGPAERDTALAAEVVPVVIAALHAAGYRHVRTQTRHGSRAQRLLEELGVSRTADEQVALPDGSVVTGATYVSTA